MLVAFCSCASTKWKIQYTETNAAKLKEKYAMSDEISVTLWGSEFSHKPFKDKRRRDVKKDLKALEKIFASTPDSIKINSENDIDSFYYNKNKILYIKTHALQTENIHFIIKP